MNSVSFLSFSVSLPNTYNSSWKYCASIYIMWASFSSTLCSKIMVVCFCIIFCWKAQVLLNIYILNLLASDFSFSLKTWQNYSSIITVHPEVIDGRPGTIVIESFVVDIPDGNTKDETCFFVEALIRCNLKSLADVSERLAVQGHTEPIDRM